MLRLRHIWMASVLTTLTLAMGLTACSDDETGDEGYSVPADKVAVELTIRMKVSTLAADYDGTSSTWENYINIHGDDYRIYFFTSTNTTDPGYNTLIAELEPTSVYSSTSGADYVTYTIRGELDGSFATTSAFKVVVAANWGTYPTLSTSTTMADLCSAGTYSALVEDGTAVLPSSTKHIPFYGVQDYTGVEWELGHTTSLSGNISMLRAVAKVEIILEAESDTDISFSDVSIVNYNSIGYCAPAYYDVTSSSDTYDLHIPSNATGSGSIALVKTQERGAEGSEQYETWTAYIPEYDNMTSGVSHTYIAITVDESSDPFYVHFADYEEETTVSTTAAVPDGLSLCDITRNTLYQYTLRNTGAIGNTGESSGQQVKAQVSAPSLLVTSQSLSLY